MKSMTEKVVFTLIVMVAIGLVVAFLVTVASSGTVVVSGVHGGVVVSSTSKTYANSQVDTVWWTAEPNVRTLGFAVLWADSVSITNVIVRRSYSGILASVIAGDTLSGLAGASTVGAGVLKTSVVALSPLCEHYAFIVAYAGSANGVTTPVVYYQITKSY